MDERARSRVLGFLFVGGLSALGGLAALWRASYLGGPRWRVMIACASLGVGVACLVAGFVQRRKLR